MVKILEEMLQTLHQLLEEEVHQVQTELLILEVVVEVMLQEVELVDQEW